MSAPAFSPAAPALLVPPARAVRAGATFPAVAQGWFAFGVGSLVLAGLLSLLLVVGRLPFLGWLFTDPLFFKRALVVHVDLAIVIWFQAGTLAYLAWAVGPRVPRGLALVALALAGAGILGLLAGAVMPGAQPILANYVPVVDHPVFLAGLGAWFAGSGLYFAGALAAPVAAANPLPDDAVVALRASAAAHLVALATFVAAWRSTLTGLPAIGYYELVAWGGGHVMQVGNVALMLGLWLLLLRRWSGHAVLSPAAVRWLFVALVLPQVLLPVLAWGGTSRPAYSETATQLMRWTIFPVVLIVLGLALRHVRLHWAGAPAGRWRLVGFAGSAVLTVLGFVLGAFIRGSSTLVPGHYHCAIGAVTIALMAAAYDFSREAAPRAATPSPRLVRWQLLLFGGGQAVFGLGFALAGAFGLGRKQYGVEQHVRSAGEYLGLGVMGLGGLVAVAGGILFLALMLRALGAWRARSSSPAP
jgi:cytochrome c oxidase subunit 1